MICTFTQNPTNTAYTAITQNIDVLPLRHPDLLCPCLNANFISCTSCAHSCSDRVQYPSLHTRNATLSIDCKNINAAKFRNMASMFTTLNIRKVLMQRNIIPSTALARWAEYHSTYNIAWRHMNVFVRTIKSNEPVHNYECDNRENNILTPFVSTGMSLHYARTVLQVPEHKECHPEKKRASEFNKPCTWHHNDNQNKLQFLI